MIDFSGADAGPMPMHEENGFSFSADEVLALITPATRLLIVNIAGEPHRRRRSPESWIDAGGRLARHPDVAVLSDEIYGPMTYDGDAPHQPAAVSRVRDRLIILDGASKTYAMTGWRLGWRHLAGAALRDRARKLAINAHSCVNAATQCAGVAALTGPQDAVARHGRGLRPAPRRRRRGVEPPARRPLRRCRAARSMPSPTSRRTGLSARELQDRWLDEIGVATIAGPASASAARATPLLLRELARQHPRGHAPDRRLVATAHLAASASALNLL